MSRLAIMFDILDNAHRADVRQRRNLRRIARYADNAFSMTDEEFKLNYRVTKELFEIIYSDLEPLISKTTRRSDISPRFKVLVALSFYATGSYQRLIGGTHGTVMSQQSVSRAIDEVTSAFNREQILNKWLKFPQTRRQRDSIKRRFYEKYSIPSIVGCIDGTHIAIKRPVQNEERFYNRKGYYSKNVLIICDADLNILTVDASFGGATSDSFVWNKHPVRQHLINLNNADERVLLLGDSDYPQSEYLMTPINNAPSGSAEVHYSKLHSIALNTIERSIEVLKNRWRCLLGHRVLHYHPDKAAKLINACCVLHNMCNKMGLQQNDNKIIHVVSSREAILQEGIAQYEEPASSELRRGVESRARLVQELWRARHIH